MLGSQDDSRWTPSDFCIAAESVSFITFQECISLKLQSLGTCAHIGGHQSSEVLCADALFMSKTFIKSIKSSLVIEAPLFFQILTSVIFKVI